MRDEALALLAGPRPARRVVDATLGGGGHTLALLEAGMEVVAIDRDEAALRRAEDRLADWLRGPDPALTMMHGDFGTMQAMIEQQGLAPVDGVLMDLGLSSDQLNDPARGFSFQHDGPLDMRMGAGSGPAAAEWLHAAGEAEMARAFRELADERRARPIARAIVRARGQAAIQTTGQLAALVERAVGGRRGARIHPATKVFQAVRMVVNRELESLREGLAGAMRILRPGGVLCAITFHSAEDRVVKHRFAEHVGREVSLPQGGSRWEGAEPRATWLRKRPLRATEAETAANPRARSAKLRAIARAGETT